MEARSKGCAAPAHRAAAAASCTSPRTAGDGDFNFEELMGDEPGGAAASAAADDLIHGEQLSDSGSNQAVCDELSARDLDDDADLDALAAEGSELPPFETDYQLVFGDEKTRRGVDDFKLLYMLGQGGFGKVFLVVEKETGSAYAMKVLRKEFLVKTKNVTYTRTERNVLRTVRHPFICGLHFAFQTHGKLYLVLDWAAGGPLFNLLHAETLLTEEVVRFYAAEVVVAIEHLHSLGIVHRDIKPENILLSAEGHVMLTDMGLCKENMHTPNDRTSTMCGTLEYTAPEIILCHQKGGGYGKSTDWWSVGILITDMLTGSPPFKHKNDNTLKQKILTEKLKLPTYLSSEASSLIRGLLNRDTVKRFGSVGTHPLRQQRFFQKINWRKLEALQVEPPFIPPKPPSLDAPPPSIDLAQTAVDSPVDSRLSTSQQASFMGWSYVRGAWSPSHSTPALDSSASSK